MRVFQPWLCWHFGENSCAVLLLSPGAATTEPTYHSYWSQHAQSPCSTAKEATAMRSLCTTTNPHSATREKLTQQRSPSKSQLIKKILQLMQETQETWVPSLGWEDSLEEEMATYSTILACEIWWTEMPSELQYMGSQKNRTRLRD